MKKRLVMMVITGILACSMCACGSKEGKTDAGQEAEVQTNAIESSTTTEKVSDREDYVAIQDLDTEEYVTLNDYNNMVVEAELSTVSDESIKEYIENNIFTSYAITDRAAVEGDTVTIDFVGKKDDVAFQGGTATDYKLTLGSNTFIPGFEAGLIGVTPGETVNLDLTFPEDYQSAELAGQAVVFEVTVKDIQERAKYDTVTPEQLAVMGLEGKSLDDIWAEAKAALEEEAKASYEARIANEILKQLMEECTVTSVPEYLVEEEVEAYNSYMEQISNLYYGCDLETYITNYQNISMEEYNDQLQKMSEETIKQYLILEEVARKEGISVTDEEVMEKATQEAAMYGYDSAEELLEATGKTLYRMYMIQENVLEKLRSTVTVK